MKPLLALLFNFLLSATIFAQTKNSGLQITKLTENSYIYITSHVYKNSIATANGLYVVTNQDTGPGTVSGAVYKIVK